MVVRWFRGEHDVPKLGRDHRISRATAYRYLHEGIEVLAAQAPDLHEALERAQAEGLAYVILDGTLIPIDRCAEQTLSVKGEPIDAWYSGKAHQHAGNLQALSAPDGLPLWRATSERLIGTYRQVLERLDPGSETSAAGVEAVARAMEAMISCGAGARQVQALGEMLSALVVQTHSVQAVRAAVEQAGGFAAQLADIEEVAAFHGDAHEVPVYRFFKKDRPAPPRHGGAPALRGDGVLLPG